MVIDEQDIYDLFQDDRSRRRASGRALVFLCNMLVLCKNAQAAQSGPLHILFDSITVSDAVHCTLSKQNAISYSTECQNRRRYQCPHWIQRGK